MYKIGEKKATREAYGAALAEFGADPRIVVLDADLSKSTKTENQIWLSVFFCRSKIRIASIRLTKFFLRNDYNGEHEQ